MLIKFFRLIITSSSIIWKTMSSVNSFPERKCFDLLILFKICENDIGFKSSCASCSALQSTPTPKIFKGKEYKRSELQCSKTVFNYSHFSSFSWFLSMCFPIGLAFNKFTYGYQAGMQKRLYSHRFQPLHFHFHSHVKFFLHFTATIKVGFKFYFKAPKLYE